MRNKRIIFAFNISVIILSVFLMLYFALSEDGVTDLVKNNEWINKYWLILAFFSMMVNWFFDSLIIYFLVKATNKEYSIAKSIKASMVGQFYSELTPFASGGQPMQIYTMKGQGVDAGHSGSVLIQKFFVYQVVITIYSFFAMVFSFQYFSVRIPELMLLATIGFIVQAAVIIAILLFSTKPAIPLSILTVLVKFLGFLRIVKNKEKFRTSVETQLELFHENNKELKKSVKLSVITFFLTVLQVFAFLSIPYFIHRAFSLPNMDLFLMIWADALVIMISSFVPLPGASFASEGCFIIFFKSFFTASTLKSAVLIWRMITYFFSILLGAPFSLQDKRKEKKALAHEPLEKEAKEPV